MSVWIGGVWASSGASRDWVIDYVTTHSASALNYVGGYNAATNTPDLDTSPSGITKGDFYTVTAAGTFFTAELEIDDALIAEKDDPTLESDWTILNKNIDPSIPNSAFTQDGGILVGTGAGTYTEETGATLRASIGVDLAGTDNSTDVTLDSSATTGGMSITGQAISNRAATNAQTGYATDSHITAIESNTSHRGSSSNPHSVSLEQARTANNALSGDIDFNNNDIVDIKGIGFKDGQEITWNQNDYTIDIPTGVGPILQVGQEIYIVVYNNTGVQIDNFKAVHPIGSATDGYPNIVLANATDHTQVGRNIWVTTMDIPTGSKGIVTTNGKIRNVNTSTWDVGDMLWLDSTDGGLTNTKPDFPNYAIQLGGVAVSDETAGVVNVYTRGVVEDTIINCWNGVFRETFDFRVTSTGGVITGSLSPSNGHDNMTMMFSDGFTMLDTTPAATITLTAGTDTNPQINYVYIPKTTKVLTVSTSGWPITEAIRVANILLKSASSTESYGALKNQNWNDAIENTDSKQGHMSHIGAAIREKIQATWKSGIEGVSTIVTASTPDDVWVSTTAGYIMQMHNQEFGAFNTQTGSFLKVVNHPTTPYLTITNLNTQLLDASGVSLNNTSFSFVLWGVGNKTGEQSHLMINLPSNSYAYASPIDAISDAYNYSVYDIPYQFQGVGFLIARFTYTYKNDVWTLEDTEDLRGKVPNIMAGGGAGGTGVTTFLGLTDTPSTFGTAGQSPVVNTGGTALEFVTRVSEDAAQTLTNKRITPRVLSTTSSATPTINTDNCDIYQLTAQAEAITSMTTNLSGTPVEGDVLIIEITGTAARVITWGASFEDSIVTLPATTTGTDKLTVCLMYNDVTDAWRCTGWV